MPANEFLVESTNLGYVYVTLRLLVGESMKGVRIDVHSMKKERWWIKLGKTDEDREMAFNHRKRCRNAWYPEFRECIGRALGEVRQLTMVANKLVPRQKRRRIFGELGNNTQDSHDGLSEGISVASVEL
ncbi:unnamed protein product [Heligmosomoides polygyrus]|uniref:Uncharacterized protein n=1 Tax=Heligmosomoides polygyrus TaxID=6339 RepID=A0A183F381_HELPZ|nr:unnamed protein product [Heligmosomoides polygyrus]